MRQLLAHALGVAADPVPGAVGQPYPLQGGLDPPLFGISISCSCAKKTVTVYCTGLDSGVPVGQVTTKLYCSPELPASR